MNYPRRGKKRRREQKSVDSEQKSSKNTNRAKLSTLKTKRRKRESGTRKVNVPTFVVEDVPCAVVPENPPANSSLIGKYILLGWPEDSIILWYGCRVCAFDTVKNEHVVMYEYGDEEWSIENVNLNNGSRMWRLAEEDPLMKTWERADTVEARIGRVVRINANEDDSDEVLRSKTGLILGIVDQFRGFHRRGRRFTLKPTSPERFYQVMWIYDGFKYTESQNTNQDAKCEDEQKAGDICEVNISACSFSPIV